MSLSHRIGLVSPAASMTMMRLLTALSLMMLIHCSDESQHLQVTAQIIDDVPNVNQIGSVNLKTILEHQNALRKQCAQLELQTRRQLAALADFDSAHEYVQLPNPLPVKLPAICVLLNSEFNGDPDSSGPNRLEMVNWIYTESDWNDARSNREAASSNSSKVKKRQVAGEGISVINPSNSLVNNYLFDVGAANQGPFINRVPPDDDLNSIDSSLPTFKFRKEIDAMLNDDKFRDAIEKARSRIEAKLSPVILIPGLLGSRLQARTFKVHRVNIFCSKQSNWQEVWLSLRAFLPWVVDCWLDNARLEFDPTTGFARQPAGIEAQVPDFGSVQSVRHLDLRSPSLTGYFEPIIARYESLGYTADKNLLAAPYDFRVAPQQLMDTYYVQLKQLIEQAQTRSSTMQPVTLVCHSMGCTHLLAFLRRQSPAWRQKRIRKVIALGSPWAGSVKSLKAIVVGDELEMPLVSPVKMRKLARSFPSISFLLPQASYFSPDQNLVETPERNYKVSQMEELLKDLNLTTNWNWFEATSKLIKSSEPLIDVHIDCIHSLNIPTPMTLHFNKLADLPNGEHKVIKGDGDGTVNYESLMVCADWASKLPDKVKHQIIYNTNHVGLLSNKKFLDYITDDVLLGVGTY